MNRQRDRIGHDSAVTTVNNPNLLGSKTTATRLLLQEGVVVCRAATGAELGAELANPFASCDVRQLKEKYAELNEAISRQTQNLAAAVANVNREWEPLLPYLSQMQALLSQRGDQRVREADLPTWTDWLEGFKKKIKWQISLRAIQKRLATFREPGVCPIKRESGLGLSAGDQRRLIDAARIGYQIVEAFEKGGDFASAIADYKKVALNSKRLSSILESQCVESPESALNAQVANLALEACEILNGTWGDRLMGNDDGKRVMAIVKEVLRLKSGRRPQAKAGRP